jgi:hypothetical protein
MVTMDVSPHCDGLVLAAGLCGDLTCCSSCRWWMFESSSTWKFCCLRSCACSEAGSRQFSKATRFFSLSHVTTWAHVEDQVLLPLTSGVPRRKGNPPPQPITPGQRNLMRLLQECLKLLQPLQLAAPGPCSLFECLLPAEKGCHGPPGSPMGPGAVCAYAHASWCPDSDILFETKTHICPLHIGVSCGLNGGPLQCFSFLFFCCTRFELRALHLLGRYFTS